MSDLKKLQELALKFRDDRDWKQFHNPKDLTIALVSEAVELMDEFKWMSEDEVKDHLRDNKQSVADEVSDVLYLLLAFAHDIDIDITKEFERKIAQNEKKYPIHKSKGSHTKYDKLAWSYLCTEQKRQNALGQDQHCQRSIRRKIKLLK